MNSIALKDLKPKLYFSKPLFLDEGFVLLTPEIPVDEGLIKRLAKWGFRETRTAGESLEEALGDGASSERGEEQADSSNLPDGGSDKEQIDRFLGFYSEFTAYMDSLYTR